MGGGISKGMQAGVKTASPAELQQAVGGLDTAEKTKLLDALKVDDVPKPPTSITVYYHGPVVAPFYGRAIGIYLTLDQAGVKYEMKGPQDMPAGSALAVPVIDVDGFCMGQCPAILTALGEMFQLSGKTPEEKMRCLQALEDMNDVLGERGKMAESAERKTKWF